MAADKAPAAHYILAMTRYVLALTVALAAPAMAQDARLFEIVPMIEDAALVCRTGADHFGEVVDPDAKEDACRHAIEAMEEMKALGYCRDNVEMTWSKCDALPPEWAVGAWRTADKSAIINVLPVGFRYSVRGDGGNVYQGHDCAYMKVAPNELRFDAECTDGVFGQMAFFSETEMTFDLMTFHKVSD